jgi:undecaprenyl-diphosphatase
MSDSAVSESALSESALSRSDGGPAPEVAAATESEERGGERRWDGSWPIRKAELARLAVALVAVVGAFSLVGLSYTDWFAPNAVTRFDDRVAELAADNRTSFLTDVSPWVAFPADTYTKITISALICLFLLWLFRRWYEAVYVALPLVFEACAFITTTHIVGRDRPQVERLIDSEVATSYPSGHVAAATVYAAVAVIVVRHTRAAWARTLAMTLAVLVPLGVAWARVYQGMHFLTDVSVGVVLGVVSLLITHRVLAPHEPPDLEPVLPWRSRLEQGADER